MCYSTLPSLLLPLLPLPLLPPVAEQAVPLAGWPVLLLEDGLAEVHEDVDGAARGVLGGVCPPPISPALTPAPPFPPPFLLRWTV